MGVKNLHTYASMAEILAAVAIVVSLVYAANEFRRAGTISSREADVILFERAREANRLLIESPGLAEIVTVAETAPESFVGADRLRYLAFQHDFFDAWEIGWGYHADGILDADVWQEWDRWFVTEARRRPVFGWTENRANFTGTGFREHVDQALATGAPDR